MRTVPASEFQKNFGVFKEIAQREPITVTSNGRESVVLISATEYHKFNEAAQRQNMSDVKTAGLKMREALLSGNATVQDIEREIKAALNND